MAFGMNLNSGVTDNSPTYRFSTALLALLFVLGWGGPTAHAACTTPGARPPAQCGDSESAQHCEGQMGDASAVCLTHHASQDAHAERGASEESWTGGSGEGRIRTSGLFEKRWTAIVVSSGRAVQRGRRLHARVGVWLE